MRYFALLITKKYMKLFKYVLSLIIMGGVLFPVVASADVFNRQMELGMRGTDISTLQTYLAQDSSLYPQGLVTGYFGFLTKSAVSNFQSRNGISAVGRVGPATLPVLNQMYNNIGNGYTVSNGVAPTIMNVNTSASNVTATINWNTNDLAKGMVYYSTSPLVTYERENAVDVSGFTAMTDANVRFSQNVVLNGLQSNTIYYYMIYVTDEAGNVSVTWPNVFRTN
jgi:peptidoglycan hydrolase-like protein with peptidoglycan-binding domain